MYDAWIFEPLGFYGTADEGMEMPELGALGWAFLVLALVSNSFYEELLMRAYLITRLRQLGVRVVLAVLVAGVLFGAYHIYQGPAQFITASVFGLLLGLIFVLTGRVWPLIIAHTIYNLDVFAFAAILE